MTPIAPCCGANTSPGDDCPISPHAATGWCLAATGAPVLVVTTLPCPPGDAELGGVNVTLIDPGTGGVVAPQAIVACGDKDWEVNQLCDYDPGTGELIATFIQVFEWDEDTGTLVITNVRADDPTVPYVPTGTVRACSDDQTQTDVEVTDLCYDPAGVDTLAHGWQAWIFVNGVYSTSLYFDAAGAPLVAPTIVECPDLATEATLVSVLASVDGLEACCAASNVLLSLIHGDVDGVEALLTSILSSVDGLEACCAAGNVLLAAIDGHVDGIEGLLTTISATLTTINTNVDGLEACCAAGNALLTLIHGDVDGVEGLLTSILASVDGLEACCAASNVLLTAIDGHVDGIEGLLTTINASTTAIATSTATSATAVKLEDSAHVSGDAGVPAWAVRNDAGVALTGTDGDYSPIAVDLAGKVKTADTKSEDNAHTSGDIGSFVLGVRNDANAVRTSADGDYSPISVDDAGRVKLAASKNEDAPHVSGDTGFAVWGVRNDAAAVLTSADGDYSPVATDSAGRLGISDLGGSITVDGTLVTTPGPSTSGGLSIYKNLDVNATGVNIKASAGQVYTIIATNRNNAERFLKLYNKASAPVVGTDVPVITIPLDGKTGGGQTQIEIDISSGAAFSLGIGIGATTGIADANAGNPSANDVVITILYK